MWAYVSGRKKNHHSTQLHHLLLLFFQLYFSLHVLQRLSTPAFGWWWSSFDRLRLVFTCLKEKKSKVNKVRHAFFKWPEPPSNSHQKEEIVQKKKHLFFFRFLIYLPPPPVLFFKLCVCVILIVCEKVCPVRFYIVWSYLKTFYIQLPSISLFLLLLRLLMLLVHNLWLYY
jgi:hypothetical protein